jgi:RNA polymerase sigma-70 factor (ECF subfamily)
MHKDLPYDIKILLRQVAEDDEQAFRRVFDHYKAPFHATAFKMTRSTDIAEEIVQEVFVTLWVKRKLIAIAKKPEGYVFTILHNCIYAHFRKLVLERQLKSKMSQAEEQSENRVETLLLEKESKTIIENVISQLPPQQKLIYRLSRQQRLSREKIALELKISPNTVKNHLSAAMDYLRTYLKKSLSVLIWAITGMHL